MYKGVVEGVGSTVNSSDATRPLGIAQDMRNTDWAQESLGAVGMVCYYK